MSATLARHAEQRQAAAELARLAAEERRAFGAYMSAPESAENDFGEDSPHMRWHRAMQAWSEAQAAYDRRWGDNE